MRLKRYIGAFLVALVLVSCGDGDDGAGSTVAQPDLVTGSTSSQPDLVSGSTVASEPDQVAEVPSDPGDQGNCIEVEQRTVETAAEDFTRSEGAVDRPAMPNWSSSVSCERRAPRGISRRMGRSFGYRRLPARAGLRTAPTRRPT